MSIRTDTIALTAALNKLTRTKQRQEEALAATIGQIELFEDLLEGPKAEQPKTARK